MDQVRQRAVRDQQRLDSGAVTSPKDLENLQREIASLAKRQGDLEDVVLEVMERRESAQERVGELTERVSSVQAKIDDATARRDAAFEEIDGEAATVTKEREVVAGSVPADLLKLYDKLREKEGGVGAARLYQRRCEGCRLELNITELNEVRAAAPDAVVRCENCRRILVRTAESGL
ncbi:C4-type zinc ribbon domain-containing protein [Streptomyces sp. B-S-A6]|uniref:C4-type zinc ribbon domain-containing protein n=1 Tax=Streptomyces cavernicola TaxID=3043613 RepID=A0ABT6SCL4_9ACTN|nr:C4-type zinc ribbon domain-containing protein [Streptomyces sp. B-S-A6]MDI3405936.1 C4-type zinc ribbon domain-containing protein [Streptomyces sp. B-S-A6]